MSSRVGTLSTDTLDINHTMSTSICTVYRCRQFSFGWPARLSAWGVRELAEKAGVNANTVTRIENGADAKQSTMDALRRALEGAGIEFTNGEQPGVRLTKAGAAQAAEPTSASNPTLAAQAGRPKTAKAAKKKR